MTKRKYFNAETLTSVEAKDVTEAVEIIKGGKRKKGRDK